MDLSVLIAARHELFLRQTVADVLTHAKGETEVIVVCDGEPPIEPLAVDPRLRVVILPESIGQRAAVNLAARLSDARYLMKLDAHCAVSDGFDVALVRVGDYLEPHVVQIPKQYNLHVFDWQCQACGHRTYQGPTPTVCASKTCRESGPFDRIIVWDAVRRLTEAWRFDASLTFGYFGAWKDRLDKAARARQEPVPDVFETMSCLGACWFLDRAFYGVLGGLDEGHGSWGNMGTELSCKAWLSGGRMVTNRRAWFSHLFRTQGGDFGFPYPLTGSERDAAREYSRGLWLENRWSGQVRPLRWLVEKFWPVPGWSSSQLDALPRALGERAA